MYVLDICSEIFLITLTSKLVYIVPKIFCILYAVFIYTVYLLIAFTWCKVEHVKCDLL